MHEFDGKIVLVTGGTQGIGLAIAEAFREAGATIHITGTRNEADDYGRRLDGLAYHQLRVGEAETVERLLAGLPEIDILVNNVGGGDPREFETEIFNEVIQKNLVSVMDLCTRYRGSLAQREGNIVNIGSVASFASIKDRPAYSAAKAGLLGLTRALADRWAKDGIRVNLVAPGFVHTERTSYMRADKTYESRLIAAIPMKRWAEAAEIAGPVLFLASSAASYVTGTSLVVDGGVLVR